MIKIPKSANVTKTEFASPKSKSKLSIFWWKYEKGKKRIFEKIQSFKNDYRSNIWQFLYGSGCRKRGDFPQSWTGLQVVLRFVELPSFSASFSNQEISPNFVWKLWNCCSRKFIFRCGYKIEYLSNLDEKWMVREVNFSSFVTCSNRFGTNSNSTFPAHF